MYAEERANAARQASIAKSRVVLAEQIEEKKRMQAAATAAEFLQGAREA